MLRFTLICVSVFFLLALTCCGNNEPEAVKDANAAYYDSIRHLTGLGFQPAIKSADSVQVIFYTNPDGDPKRYTRYYTLVNLSDSLHIKTLKASIDKSFERLESVKSCRSEGKFFFFSKGNPVQTIYFSNRGDSCNHLYFIADGWFYYMPMDSTTAQNLKDLKAKSTDTDKAVQP
jgi:hypothetical protein